LSHDPRMIQHRERKEKNQFKNAWNQAEPGSPQHLLHQARGNEVKLVTTEKKQKNGNASKEKLIVSAPR